jgi:hypothetical protein
MGDWLADASGIKLIHAGEIGIGMVIGYWERGCTRLIIRLLIGEILIPWGLRGSSFRHGITC